MKTIFLLLLLAPGIALGQDYSTEPRPMNDPHKLHPGEKKLAEGVYLVPKPKQYEKTTYDEFEMPMDERLHDCAYVPGFSFPSVCTDANNNIIFNSDKDDQPVLDRIIKMQGKAGKYNKLPNGKHVPRKYK